MTKGFIIRDIPGWLFSHQDWISDNARKLLQAMVKLADTKTGNLLIPGRGWIRARAVERKANLCTRYRKTYMQELVRLGFVRWERPTVRRRIKNRLRAVRGGTHYTVLFHNIKTASVNAGSSTVHGKPNGEIASLDADLSQPEGTKQYEQGGCSTVQNDETTKSEPQN